MTTTKRPAITSFSKEHRWLSNFWPCQIMFDDMEFSSVEHAYVAAKTFVRQERELIQSIQSPGEVKRFGRTLELRSSWNGIKLPIMENLLRQKFAPNSDLAKTLVQTGDAELIEGNWWGDTFWGVCKGEGSNHLGKLLMKVRKDLQR